MDGLKQLNGGRNRERGNVSKERGTFMLTRRDVTNVGNVGREKKCSTNLVLKS